MVYYNHHITGQYFIPYTLVGGFLTTHLKNISQIGSFPQVGVNIKKYLKAPRSIYISKRLYIYICKYTLNNQWPFLDCSFTHPKFNMEPENDGFQSESPFPMADF